jgi:hypothetical protein
MKELLRPDYYHIPALVAESVSPHESFVWAIIYWFEKMKDGRCYASNERIAEALPYQSSPQSVTNALMKLESMGFIKREYKDEKKTIRKEIKITVSLQKIDLENEEGGTPTGLGGYTHRFGGGTPTGLQTSNIRKLKDTSEIEISQDSQSSHLTEVVPPYEPDDLTIEPDESVTPTRSLKRKNAPPKSTAPQVFSAFAEVLGVKTGSWIVNKTERQHAEILFEERGIDKIRQALEIYKANKTDPYCPTVVKPSALSSKWSELVIYNRKKKN